MQRRKSAIDDTADITVTPQSVSMVDFSATKLQNKSWADKKKPWLTTYINLPTYEQVKDNKVLYAHASRIFHQEVNPTSAKPLVQKHGDRIIWLNPPAKPLSESEMDGVFGLPYQRVPHPSYGDAKIPAYDMIKTSINIMRGCFGGCTFALSPSMKDVSFKVEVKILLFKKLKIFKQKYQGLLV